MNTDRNAQSNRRGMVRRAAALMLTGSLLAALAFPRAPPRHGPL